MKTEVKKLTPEMAKEMLKRNGKNRKISDSHVKFLAQEMLSGRWMFDGQPIRTAIDGRLLDGQHRLSAVVESGTTQEFLVISGLQSESFKVMDTGKNRNAADVMSIHGVEDSKTVAATTRMIYKLSSGLSTSNAGRMSNTVILDYYNQHPEILKYINDSREIQKEFSRVLPLYYIAAMKYLMARVNVVDSEEFWRKLCTGLGLESDNPIYILRKKLVSDRMDKASLPEKEKNAIVIKAWNHYRQGNKIKIIKWQKENEQFPKIM